jgi:TetR/AcrR family fatty acid metabolism transcriptional regulator
MPQPFDRESKRRGLVEAARKVFARQGFLPTRVADVAVEAGVGKGTVYEYFSSKEELMFAVFESIQSDIAARVEAILGVVDSATDAFRRLMEFGAEITAEQVELQAVMLDFWAASRGGALEGRFTEHSVANYRYYRSLVADLVRRGQSEGDFDPAADPEAIAVMLVSAIDGLGVQLFFDREVQPSAAVDRFTTTLLDGLLAVR